MTVEDIIEPSDTDLQACPESVQTYIDNLHDLIDGLRKAQSYTYIEKDGKTVLAADLEDSRDEAERRAQNALQNYLSETAEKQKALARQADLEKVLEPFVYAYNQTNLAYGLRFETLIDKPVEIICCPYLTAEHFAAAADEMTEEKINTWKVKDGRCKATD